MCKYCLECDWQISTTQGHTEKETSEKAIEHFVETGHTVDTLRPPPTAVLRN